MKRHLTLSTTGRHSRSQGAAQAIVDRTTATDGETDLSRSAYTRPRLTLASARIWRHTLILTGKLDHRSAPELEDEIECLYQEGVTSLTLDLRQLDEIDSTGVAVITFRSALCKRRGHAFAVIPGSRVIYRALAEAGTTDLLTPERDDSVVSLPYRSVDARFSDMSTTMIRDL
jgi:anti-sigma B factor antagonist